jgi:cytochrome c peroxidase
LNVGWQTSLFADGGGKNLESVALAPLHAETEMAGSIKEVVAFLQQDSAYVRLVSAAFRTDSVQSKHVLRSLAQYMRMLVSNGSRADGARLTEQELEGEEVFMVACEGCHKKPFYTDFSFHALGNKRSIPMLPLETLANGRFRITQNVPDIGAFKTPSLRNVARTPPYFQDGSIICLDSCLDHGTMSMPYLASKMGKSEKVVRSALVSYLIALSDTSQPYK